MKKESRAFLFYLIIIIALYYGLPALIQNSGKEAGVFVNAFLLPCICFFGVLLYYLRPNMKWFFIIALAVCMAPWMFVFFSQISWAYMVSYEIVIGVAACLGMFFHMKVEN